MTSSTKTRAGTIRALAATTLTVATLALSACGGSSDDSSSASSSASASASASASESTSASASESPSASSDDSGSSDSGSNDDKAAASISKSIVSAAASGSGSTFFNIKKQDGDCIGKGFVDKIGSDQLKDYGLLDKNYEAKTSVSSLKMSAADATSATDVLFGCTDISGMMTSALEKSGKIPVKSLACFKAAFSDDNMRPLFEQVFQGQQNKASKSLIKPLTKCARSATPQ